MKDSNLRRYTPTDLQSVEPDALTCGFVLDQLNYPPIAREVVRDASLSALRTGSRRNKKV